MAATLKVNGVCQLLIERDFAEDVVEIFRENRIDGSVLIDLTVDDMKELGVKALGDRKKLNQLIEAVKSDRHTPVIVLESPRSDNFDQSPWSPRSDNLDQSPLSDVSPTSPQAITTLDTQPPRRRILDLVGNAGSRHESKPKQKAVSLKPIYFASPIEMDF